MGDTQPTGPHATAIDVAATWICQRNNAHSETNIRVRVVGLCCFMTPGLSKTFGVMYDHTFSNLANHQIRHQGTHKVDCQPGDCI